VETPIVETVGEEELKQFLYLDQALFDTVEPIWTSLEVSGFVAPETLRQVVEDQREDESLEDQASIAVRDLYELSRNCTTEHISLLTSNSSNERPGSSREVGISAFLGDDSTSVARSLEKPLLPADLGLAEWVERINATWT
jgi:hypothetical protein